ncbi:NAD(+) diphosphatase, partial [Micrococcus sp. HSID17227]
MASCPPSSSDPTAAPPLALPLAREELDRGAVARLDPGHLAASWAREGTEVLWLQGG